jgi:hypothetical protein
MDGYLRVVRLFYDRGLSPAPWQGGGPETPTGENDQA